MFVEVATASAAATATRSRLAKVAAFADLLGRLRPDEVEPVVAVLSGELRQRRTGVGWATIAAIDVPPAVEPTLEVLDVDAVLDRLVITTGAGSVAARSALLTDLFARATAEETDHLRRLLMGELRQGALESLVADAVARAAGLPVAAVRRAAMLSGQLPVVARLAFDGGEATLEAIGLTVGRALQPMLAATAASVAEALALTGEASVEWKLDGARIQAHRDGDEVRLFTRNLNEVTDRLPSIVALVRSFPAARLVLDGEAIGIDEDSSRPDRFQDTMSRFGRQTGDAGAVLVARFFDVLHRDGTDLLERPLAERLAALDAVAGAAAMPRIVTADPDVAAAFAEDALARGHEGVMVKALSSPYEAGRRGGSWRKVKPVRTLDLVVLAVEWGTGRRQGWLSNLHLGARGDDGFVMVGKTFKGLTDELLTWQTAELLAREVRRDGHVVHVHPELVVEIALDGVQASTRYPGGVALRFARVRRYRDDKTPADADTIESVQSLLG
ncbi:MAG: ATP-dependent DNA ligase [Acidimicrobiia bacterium]|nr:ATP-dependent DNA ligase [Acidimicrobiia bacterium]